MSSRSVTHEQSLRTRSSAATIDHMLYDATPDYAHSLEVRDPRRLLFVSGTMGLDADGTAPAHAHEQLDARVGQPARDPRASTT